MYLVFPHICSWCKFSSHLIVIIYNIPKATQVEFKIFNHNQYAINISRSIRRQLLYKHSMYMIKRRNHTYIVGSFSLTMMKCDYNHSEPKCKVISHYAHKARMIKCSNRHKNFTSMSMNEYVFRVHGCALFV